MKTCTLIFVLVGSSMLESSAQTNLQTTPVYFPVNTMFGGAALGQTLTISAVNSLITDGANLWAGTYQNVPYPGSNPVVNLYPNSYLLSVGTIVRPLRFTVHAPTNNQQPVDVTTLTASGPLFYFGTNGMASLNAGSGVVFTTNSDGSISISSPGVITNGSTSVVLGPPNSLATSTISAADAINGFNGGSLVIKGGDDWYTGSPGNGGNLNVEAGNGAGANQLAGTLYLGGQTNADGTYGATMLTGPVTATNLMATGSFTGTLAGNASTASLATNLAGQVTVGQVTGLTVTTNLAQTLWQDTNAFNFVNGAGISDLTARAQVVAMQNILNQYGASSNVVDAILFHPKFNPTNNLSYRLRPITSSGIKYPDNFGAYFTNGAFAEIDGLPDMQTGSVFVVFKQFTGTWVVGNVYNTAWGFFNTDTSSGHYVIGNGGQYYIYSRNGTNAILESGHPTYTNMVFAVRADGVPNYYPQAANGGWVNGQKSLWTYGWQGSNTTVYYRGTQGTVNLYAKTPNGLPLGTNLPSLNTTDPLTSFRVGCDLGSVSGFSANGPWAGDVQAVFILNAFPSANLVKALCAASYAIAPETQELTVFGDSRSAWLLGYETNSFGYYMSSGNPWIDESYSGNQGTMFNTTASNYLFSFAYPPNFSRKFVWEFGVNDAYLAGAAGAAIFTNLLNFEVACANNNSLLSPITTWGAASNGSAFTYNAGYEQQLALCNQLIYSNAYLFSGIYDFGRVVNQNLLNTNNGYTLDGLHFRGTNGFIANQAIANSLIYSPNQVMQDFNQNISGSGGGLTNLNARSLVLTNTAIYAHISGTNIFWSTQP